MEFIKAVNIHWPLFFDLAATYENRRFPGFFGHQKDGSFVDSFNQDWAKVCEGDLRYLWLNPGFSGTGQWMEKCLEETQRGARIVTLTLADIGTRWFEKYVQGNALSLILRDRITFEGEQYPHLKECMISVWNGTVTGCGFWRWKLDSNNIQH